MSALFSWDGCRHGRNIDITQDIDICGQCGYNYVINGMYLVYNNVLNSVLNYLTVIYTEIEGRWNRIVN